MNGLWDHQTKVISMADNRDNLFLAMEQGTGKTRATIEILRRLYTKNKRLMKTLIISPVIVCDNWKREFRMYSKVNQNDIIVLTQAGKKRCQIIMNECGPTLDKAKIIVTNYQGMLIKDLAALIEAWKPEVIICDESQRVKTHNSKTAKAIQRIADNARNKYLLTGTPVLDGKGIDLWMQYRILDGGKTFGQNYWVFKHQFFKDENEAWKGKQNHFPKYVLRPGAGEALKSAIAPSTFRVLKKDCLDLPPLVRQEIQVELSPQQARMYKEMRDEYIAFLNEKTDRPLTTTANIAVTKGLRLQQILSGYVQTEQAGVERIDCPRLKVLRELLEDLTPHSKVIVWCVFKENYKMITEMLQEMEIGYAEIHGDISHKERIIGMDNFRSDSNVRVMVANQSAGGSGINLVEASYSIYYSKGFSLEHDLQSEARNHRGGSEIHEKVTRIDLVAPGTIDELINEALKKKQNIADSILSWKEKL